jgi:hypothetical protein
MEKMTAEQALENAHGLTFEKVWATITALGQRIDETSANIDRMGKRVDETSAIVAETSKMVGKIVNDQGKLFEDMFSANVWNKFNAYGYDFTKGSQMRFKERGVILAEVDIFLENGEYAMAIEVKSTLTNEWIDDHLERMDKVREYMDEHNDKRVLVGAVGGAIVSESARRYAERHGLYVLVQNGDNVSIAEDPREFKGKEW